MNDRINEVTLVEQDLLMTVDDFAKQEGVTPRTVYRWVELGRLELLLRSAELCANLTDFADAENDHHDDQDDDDFGEASHSFDAGVS